MDNVNHPDYYTGFSNGSEVIDITENLTFNCGNAVKYLARAGRTDGRNKGLVEEDLRKAQWYIEREIARLGEAVEPHGMTVKEALEEARRRETARSDRLMTAEDYENATAGAVVAMEQGYAWTKGLDNNWHRGGEWNTNEGMAGTEREVLREGWIK